MSNKFFLNIPAGIYLLKVNNRKARTRCQRCDDDDDDELFLWYG